MKTMNKQLGLINNTVKAHDNPDIGCRNIVHTINLLLFMMAETKLMPYPKLFRCIDSTALNTFITTFMYIVAYNLIPVFNCYP